MDTIIDAKKVGAAFVKRHLDAGHHGFVGMVADQEPGAYDKRLSWLRDNREHSSRLWRSFYRNPRESLRPSRRLLLLRARCYALCFSSAEDESEPSAVDLDTSAVAN